MQKQKKESGVTIVRDASIYMYWRFGRRRKKNKKKEAERRRGEMEEVGPTRESGAHVDRTSFVCSSLASTPWPLIVLPCWR